jgi:dolichyl-diphosphooligosaccharide--protein glycosyltransferase
MVAAWGGYVFVINLIGCHAGLLVLIGRFSTKLYRSYTAFYIVGTFLAMQVPVVGWAPFKSLEQLGPCAVFLGFQLLQYCEWQKRKKNLSTKQTWILRVQVFAVVGVALLAVVGLLRYKGYFGPMSARIRGLFVKHTKTGNPLVDSVAEHQPAQASAYAQYLGARVVQLIPYGFALVALRYFHDSSSFLLVYAITTYFFSLKMVRLILLTAPIASVLVGLFIGRVYGFLTYNILGFVPSVFHLMAIDDNGKAEEAVSKPAKEVTASKKKKGKALEKNKEEEEEVPLKPSVFRVLLSLAVKAVFVFATYNCYLLGLPEATMFYKTSHSIAKQLANPTIVQKGTLKSGESVLVDDYRDW